MANSKLKRVSEHTERAIAQLAADSNRTFIAQLDVVCAAGFEHLGLPAPAPEQPREPVDAS